MAFDHPTHEKAAEKPTVFPRYVHKAQQPDKLVETPKAYDEAVGDGWSADPVPVPVYKADGETATVYTVEALKAARDAGWTTIKPAGAPEPEKTEKPPTKKP